MSRASDRLPLAALALLALLAAGGCGLGTEIGNGVKPGDSGGDDGGDGDPQTTSDKAAKADADQAAPGGESGGANVPAAGNGNVDNQGNSDSADKGAAALPTPAVAASVLFAPCGTPFAAPYASPLKLVLRDDKGTEKYHFDGVYAAAAKTWTMTPSDGGAAMAVTAMPSSTTNAASVRNVATGALVATDQLTCSSFTVRPGALLPGTQTAVTEVSVQLASSTASTTATTTLLWYIQPGAGTPDKLLRVDVQTSGITQTLLNEL
jgi:hypothetical protein